MSLITEAFLREMLKKETPQNVKIKKGDIITPSARQFLRERGIDVLTEDSSVPTPNIKENHYEEFKPIENEFKPKFVSNYDGGFYIEKPEYMTHIRGNRLVFKDDERIVFRGKLDSTQARILEIQYQLREANPKLLLDLKEILEQLRQLLRAEVLEEEISISMVLGLSDEELRMHSHNPKKHYGIEHFVPDVEMGMEVVLLNSLRAYIRELELYAMKAFRNENRMSRRDIIQVLNRLSSAVYIMMCRVRGNFYK